MKIFFTASIFGKDKFRSNYEAIIESAKTAGHSVYSSHIIDPPPADGSEESKKQLVATYKKTIAELKKADAVIAETSTSSTSVGYIISLAMQQNKPVVLFHSSSVVPRIFSVLEKTSDKFQLINYSTVADIQKEMHFALDFIISAQDTRFNFFISPEISNYLDWVSNTRKIPRSVYLRELLDHDLEKHPEFEI